MEFSKKLTKPHGLGDIMCDSSVFSLCRRPGNCNLPFRRPRNNIITQINTKSRCGSPSIRTTCPICIRINCQASWRRRVNKKTMIKSAFEIPKNTFDMSKVRRTRIMHIETCLLNRVENVRTSKSGMLKCTAIKGVIGNRVIVSREFGTKFSRCTTGLTITHASMRK
jgi:hypothetical protein